jgi:4-amino-4-deoxy-L-arabinose transferase-like glycosyltransferase
MTIALLDVPAHPEPGPGQRPAPRKSTVSKRWAIRGLLTAFAAATAYYSTFLTAKTSPFQDEGLYLYMGHRVIGNWFHGDRLIEFPGAYFSGAPGVYPPLAALADHVGGLGAARGLSLVFVLLAGLCVYGLGSWLFGSIAGLLANGAFLCNGSVLFQAHLATFDAMMMFLVALAAYLGVRGARTNNLMYGLGIGAIMTFAFMTKYTGVVFIPVITLLSIAVGWQLAGWRIVSRALYVVVAAGALTYFWIQLFARDIIPGIETTTLSRKAMAYESTSAMAASLMLWTGPWLIAAAVSFIGARRELILRTVLLIGAVIVPLGQIRIHEATSYGKHMAFGMIFAAPLIGDLLSRVLRNTRFRGTPTVAAVMVFLCLMGLQSARRFSTGWIEDGPLVKPLAAAIAVNPTKVVLAEEGSAQRYELRKSISPLQWADTFSFTYAGKSGMPAYEEAIQESHFGVIYLSMTTQYGKLIHSYVISHSTPYILGSKAPRYLRGNLVGNWLIFVPRTNA